MSDKGTVHNYRRNTSQDRHMEKVEIPTKAGGFSIELFLGTEWMP
jgi:hypothetical protein